MSNSQNTTTPSSQIEIKKTGDIQSNVVVETPIVTQKPKKSGCGCFGCLIIFLLLGIFTLIFILFLSHWQSSRYQQTSLNDYPKVNSLEQKGIVTGSLGYPSEGIPAMGICAQKITTKEIFCTYEIIEDIKFTYKKGYELQLNPGKYQIFAHLVTEKNKKVGYSDEEKSYYSEFVTCGLNYECPSHKPITLEVKGGETTTEIDPIDWYNH